MGKSKNLLNSLQLPNLSEVEAELCKRSYYEFFKLAWHVVEPSTPFVDNWHVKYLCDILQIEIERIAKGENKTQDIIINIPPRSLKSSIVTVFLNAWAWIQYPTIPFITASYSQDLSTEHAIKTRRLIESDWYKERFGYAFSMATDQNVKSKFENNHSGSRYATSVGGSATGSGGLVIIADDPLKAKDAHSEVARKTALDWWAKTMYSRLNDQEIGIRIIVMQRLHEEDITGAMIESKQYRLINIPAETTLLTSPELKKFYKNDLFFPKRFSRRVLDDLRVALGSREYAGQYLQQPAPDDGDIIQRGWFKWFNKKDVPEDMTVNFFTDSAYGKEGSDNSATIAYSTHKGNMYVWNVYAWNLIFPDFIAKYKQVIPMAGYKAGSRCYFEPKASGISMVQQLKKDTGFHIIEDKPPVESKLTRVSTASASVEAGRVFLYRDGVGMDELIHEAILFPNGKNDDRIDALTSAIRIGLGKGDYSFAGNY